LVLLAQACLMLQHAPQASAEAFINSRFDAGCGRVFGTLGNMSDNAQNDILVRAWPHQAWQDKIR
jgi:putative acyl-CoA dehydrogenase